MKHFLFSFLAAVFMLSGGFHASAQRHTPGRPSVGVYGTFSEVRNDRFGFTCGGVNWSQYRYLTYSTYGVDVSSLPLRVTTSGNYEFGENTHEHIAYDITGGAGYFVRLYSPRSRVVILSAGVGGYTGIRLCDALSGYTGEMIDPDKGSSKSLGTVGYVLNAVPEVIFEVFPTGNLSVMVSGKARMTLVDTSHGRADWFQPYLAVGLKYYL